MRLLTYAYFMGKGGGRYRVQHNAVSRVEVWKNNQQWGPSFMTYHDLEVAYNKGWLKEWTPDEEKYL